MIEIIVACILTLIVSALCSMLEGFILSLSTAQIEHYKEKHPRAAAALEASKLDTESTTSAILTLNTFVNVFGSSIIGYLAGIHYGDMGVGITTSILTVLILFFGEILPKNIGVQFRQPLMPFLAPALSVVLFLMRPISRLAKKFLRLFMPAPKAHGEAEKEQEILLLVKKGLNEGSFTVTEKEMVSNALLMDDRVVTTLMTPMERVLALQAEERVGDVIRQQINIRYERIPVIEDSQVIGIVRRHDMLQAIALDEHTKTVRELTTNVLRIHSGATIADMLQSFLKNKRMFAIVEGSRNQTLGIITMEDILEHLIGGPISDRKHADTRTPFSRPQ